MPRATQVLIVYFTAACVAELCILAWLVPQVFLSASLLLTQ